MLPCDSWCDVVFALVVVTITNKIFTHILHLAATKRCTVVEPSIQDPRLPRQQFDQLSHLTEPHTNTDFTAWNVLWFTVRSIAWVRLDVTHNLLGLRMTDFNNSAGVEPAGPLTSPHKRKNLHSFQPQAKETSSRGKHFWVFSTTTAASKLKLQQLFVFTVKKIKSSEKQDRGSIYIQQHLTVQPQITFTLDKTST